MHSVIYKLLKIDKNLLGGSLKVPKVNTYVSDSNCEVWYIVTSFRTDWGTV